MQTPISPALAPASMSCAIYNSLLNIFQPSAQELSRSSPARRSAIPDPRPGPPRMFWPFQVSPAGPRVVRLLRGDIASHQAEAIAVSANPHLEGTLRSNYWRFSGRSNADGAVRLAGGRSLAAATAKVSARPPNLGTVELPMR